MDVNLEEPPATNRSQFNSYGKPSEGLLEMNMWQAEVMGVLTAQGQGPSDLWPVEATSREQDAEPDAASTI